MAYYFPLQFFFIYFCLCQELLLSTDVPAVDYYCPWMQLPMLLLSVDVSAADYNSHVQRGGMVQATGLLPAFYKISLIVHRGLKTCIVIVCMFFKITF